MNLSIRCPWGTYNRVSLHPARRQVGIATANFDERCPWANQYRPVALDEPDCIRLSDVMNIEKACNQWLAKRGLQVSWRRTF